MTGVEMDFVVEDSLAALALYRAVFDDLNTLEATNLEKGLNEAIFSLYGVRFHMLDANADFQLHGPRAGETPSFWFNVVAPDVGKTVRQAIAAGCSEVQPVTEQPDYGVRNAMFADPFGYIWMVQEIIR